MTKDLEDTLSELGPECRSVVERLRAPFFDSAPCVLHSVPRTSHSALSARYYLLAASLFLALGLAIWSFSSTTVRSSLYTRHSASVSAPAVYTVAYASDEFALQAILESQRCDGSWSNDYLTMQNAAALRRAHDEASQIAYKRAVRYLRTKGLGPISDSELQARLARVLPAG